MSVPPSIDRGSGWRLASAPPVDQATWSEREGRLFATNGWARVLAALGAEPLYLWHAQASLGAVVPVFVRFGLRVGFLGFPVAGSALDALAARDLASCAATVASTARLDLVRVTHSACAAHDPSATSARMEAWIDGLQDWQPAQSKRLRKDLAFARRATSGIALVDDCVDAAACHALYVSTMVRHAGRQRYSLSYFQALLALAQETRLLDVVAARVDGRVRGFAVIAVDGSVGHYLHGAVDSEARKQGLNDLLLESLVERARAMGCTRFTLMASPWEQPGLQRFKHKWGECSGLSITRDYPASMKGRCAALASSWLGRHDRRMAAVAVRPPLGFASNG